MKLSKVFHILAVNKSAAIKINSLLISKFPAGIVLGFSFHSNSLTDFDK